MLTALVLRLITMLEVHVTSMQYKICGESHAIQDLWRKLRGRAIGTGQNEGWDKMRLVYT